VKVLLINIKLNLSDQSTINQFNSYRMAHTKKRTNLRQTDQRQLYIWYRWCGAPEQHGHTGEWRSNL